MDACFFDMLHNAGDDAGFSVGDCVHIDLDGILQEFIDQDGVIRRGLYRVLNESLQAVFIVNDLHRPSSQDIGGPHNDGIADLVGNPLGFLDGGGRSVWRLDQAQFLKQNMEAFPVLCPVDIVRTGSDDLGPCLFERNGQIERGLAAKLDDDAVGFLDLDDMEDVFEGEGFEVELIGGVIVGRNGFGVGVDHDRFKSQFLQGKRGMDAAVIEFDPLADPVGSSSQDHDLHPVGGFRLILFFIGGVIVRSIGLEFGSAGVHSFVGREGFPFSFLTLRMVASSSPRRYPKLEIGEPKLFCLS